jgi:glycerophosphoryl diester phosphodiesterase
MLCIAHRGAKGHAPENTLHAFETGMKMNAHGVELDVHLSADGRLAVIHDHSLDRTTDGTGHVADLDFGDIRRYRIEGAHTVPELGEVFDLCGPGFFINVELKAAHTAGPACDLIAHYVSHKGFSYGQFMISSFDWLALQDVRRRNARIPIGVLTETDLQLAVEFGQYLEARAIHPHFHLLDRGKTEAIREKGFLVLAWTVNEPEDIAMVKAYGVDGIITDYPDRI